jgi:hypothetical protein
MGMTWWRCDTICVCIYIYIYKYIYIHTYTHMVVVKWGLMQNNGGRTRETTRDIVKESPP